jgi:hypothetical protein
MDNELLVYMDCCCLNRPADDQTQDKIRIESDAVIGILFEPVPKPLNKQLEIL